MLLSIFYFSIRSGIIEEGHFLAMCVELTVGVN